MDGQLLIAIIGAISVLISNLFWLINSYTNGEKKKYAAERDFNHLKNNQQQINQSIADFAQDIDHHLNDISRDILEIKVSLGLKKD